MASGRGINPESVFTRTNPGDAAQVVPTEATDGQAGYNVQGKDVVRVKVNNDSDVSVDVRILGFTFEDTALGEACELQATDAVAAGSATLYTITNPPSRVQAEIDPAAAATGDVTIVFESDVHR